MYKLHLFSIRIFISVYIKLNVVPIYTTCLFLFKDLRTCFVLDCRLRSTEGDILLITTDYGPFVSVVYLVQYMRTDKINYVFSKMLTLVS